MLIDLRLGIAREHITGLWWLIRETGLQWPDDQIKKLAGPFATEKEAEAALIERRGKR